MAERSPLLDATPMANTLNALAALLPRAGDKATLQLAAKLILDLRRMVIEQTIDRACFDLANDINAKGLDLNQAGHIAQLCHIASTLHESDEEQSLGLVLQCAGQVILRQKLMLQQAKLLPVQEFTGRAH